MPSGSRKAKKREQSRADAGVSARAARPFPWLWAAAAAGLVALFWAYGPALHGPFVFDDASLPYGLPGFNPSLRAWIGGGMRGLLLFTYWLNAQIGQDPFSYHVVNLLIHAIASGLIFLIVRRLLEWSNANPATRTLLAAFAAAVFLLHPVQTESVAYLAGRSESFSDMLAFAAFTVFLYRKHPAIQWGESAAVLLLFVAAALSKEQTLALPALLLLTDYWWNPGFSLAGIRGNWRLYLACVVGALVGGAIIWKVLAGAQTAGFHLKDFTPLQYFFTECRALFVYVGIFLWPSGLNADWDFHASRTLFDRGAVFGLAVLVGLAALAWIYRRRFPLACYGYFVYLVLMAPTSSFLPIQDAVAERRLYFGMLGLLLIAVDFLGRLKVEVRWLAAGCTAVALACAAATYARAAIWGDPGRLWEDTARKSPGKFRAHFQLGFAHYDQQQYGPAVEEFEKAGSLPAPDPRLRYNLLVDWALSLDGLNRPQEALAKLREAAQIDKTAHVYSQIGMIEAKQARWAQALEALDEAQRLDANYAMTYVYRGKIDELTGQPADAAGQFQRALSLAPAGDPAYEQARQEMERLRRLSPGGGR